MAQAQGTQQEGRRGMTNSLRLAYEARCSQVAQLKETLESVRQYLEENHAERIKYPEYVEFHLWRRIMLELGHVVPLWKGGEE